MSDNRKLILGGLGCSGYMLTINDEEGNSASVRLTFEEGMEVAQGLADYYKNHLISHLAEAFTGLKGEELQEKLEETGPLPEGGAGWIDELERDLNHKDIEGAEE